jgi:hypothetical protein
VQYVGWFITATIAGATYNPTGDTVQFQFVPQGGTQGTTWVTGSWLTVGTQYKAQCLVGPSPGVTGALAAGSYTVFIKITDSPEVPVLEVGTLTVT